MQHTVAWHKHDRKASLTCKQGKTVCGINLDQHIALMQLRKDCQEVSQQLQCRKR